VNISLRRYSNSADISVDYLGNRVTEDMVAFDELDSLAVALLDDTVLHGCSRYQVVDKLVQAGVINHDMIMAYLESYE
jgi:hypothetical protein